MARFPSALQQLSFAISLALLSALASPCRAQTFTDDFSRYQDGTEGWPQWQTFAVGITVRKGAVESDGGAMLWREVTFPRVIAVLAHGRLWAFAQLTERALIDD